MVMEALDIAHRSTEIVTRRSPHMAIGGVAIANVSGAEAIERVEAALAARRLMRLGFINAHCVNVARRNPAYRAAIEDFLLLPDGVGVDIGAKLLHGRAFAENLNGTDFIPRLVMALSRPATIALLGAAPGIAERAAENFARVVPQHEIVAVSDGYFGTFGRAAVLERLEALRPDIVLVAMGVPAQEIFIADHLDERHGTVFVAVGALFDFIAGNVPRAPRLARQLRAEWIWRLALEPKRLFRRYVLGNPLFLRDVILDRLRGAARRRQPR
ncbi:WecB/TagA/CpsF family glycosyltransferase [Jiella pelagia]|uniref:WecB/TagA/CpsF family glycosyltransferase n=1 Tax=Jiella pelagia TaxID=2986949 RepID=A0ABY7C0D9_9HYPH|nr:WecB/TagA/CpsF family glycosyltransferase [Jiella pelagia]WAP69571.1 WecB/TagA/CpsF family glycosyltransferase [Jiella pelagia]